MCISRVKEIGRRVIERRSSMAVPLLQVHLPLEIPISAGIEEL